MELDKNQFQALTKHLQSMSEGNCPFCKSEDLIIRPTVLAIKVYEPLSDMPPSFDNAHPVCMTTCKKCGHEMMFNPVISGIVSIDDLSKN